MWVIPRSDKINTTEYSSTREGFNCQIQEWVKAIIMVGMIIVFIEYDSRVKIVINKTSRCWSIPSQSITLVILIALGGGVVKTSSMVCGKYQEDRRGFKLLQWFVENIKKTVGVENFFNGLWKISRRQEGLKTSLMVCGKYQEDSRSWKLL